MRFASILIVAVLVRVVSAGESRGTHDLVVHEWGTFTSLQDETGRTIGGTNTDEERLPDFVYDLRPVAMMKDSDLAPRFIKFAPVAAEEVTMRLETPVVYFHLPTGVSEARVDLRVEFRGGIMSQFYPDAGVSVDGKTVVDRKTWNPRRLSATTTSSLEWKGLRVGGSGVGPKTTSPVWLAPRQVAASPVTTSAGEHEKYLFYRGLGHLDAPLVAMRSADGATLSVNARSDVLGSGATLAAIPRLWLADLRGNGTAAMRSVPAQTVVDGNTVSTIAAAFTEADYSTAGLATLRSELRAGLIDEGLFPDEADALLATWQESYFKAAGQRLFFLVPRPWTDRYLPVTVTPSAPIARAMMGRIELVSPAQRKAITRIAKGPASDASWYQQLIKERVYYTVGTNVIYHPGGEQIAQRLFVTMDRGMFTEMGVQLPDDYRAYLALGRFRDALLLEEARQRPTAALRAFIDIHFLEGDPVTKALRAAEGESADKY